MFLKLIPMFSIIAVCIVKPSSSYERIYPSPVKILERNVILAVGVVSRLDSRSSQHQSRPRYDETSEAYVQSNSRNSPQIPSNQMTAEKSTEITLTRPDFSNTEKWNSEPTKNIWPDLSQQNTDNNNNNQGSQSYNNEQKSYPQPLQNSYTTSTKVASQPQRLDVVNYQNTQVIAQPINNNQRPQNPLFNQNMKPLNENNVAMKKPELIHLPDSNPIRTPDQKVAVFIDYPTENYSSNEEYTTRKPLKRPQIIISTANNPSIL